MRDSKGKFIKGHKTWNKGVHVYLGGKRFEKGQTAWNKGLKGFMFADKNGMWKGEEAGYVALHLWLVNNYGKADHCENDLEHKAKRYEWANISGEYRRDVSDYKQLCPSCNRRDGIRKAKRFL